MFIVIVIILCAQRRCLVFSLKVAWILTCQTQQEILFTFFNRDSFRFRILIGIYTLDIGNTIGRVSVSAYLSVCVCMRDKFCGFHFLRTNSQKIIIKPHI